MSFRRMLPALAALLAPAVASATVVTPLDLDALTDRAERIAWAKVVSQTARYTADHGAIYTDVDLLVLRAVKDASGGMRAGQHLTVRREGGVVDGVGMRVIGAARFDVGEEVLVFLERRAGGHLWTVGMAQGKMHVATVEGRKVVARDASGLEYLSPPTPEPAVRPLDEVLGRIDARLRSRP